MRRAAITGLIGFLLLVTTGSSTSASTASARWGSGIEAPLPANAATNTAALINSVACSSPGNCSAVGDYRDDSGYAAGLLMTETAGKWAKGVGLAGEGGVVLDQISCSTPGNCSAAGVREGSSPSGFSWLLITETDGEWGPAVLVGDTGILSVSCTSPGNCTAVGEYVDIYGELEPVMLTETAGTWAGGFDASLPADALVYEGGDSTPQNAYLSSVSCSSPGTCSAVGSYLDSSGRQQGLLLTETAGSWAQGVAAQLPANAANYPGADISAVSCSSAGNCSAVGRYCAIGACDRSFSNPGPSGSGQQGLLLTETAGHWARGVEARLPADALAAGPMRDRHLTSISCTKPGDCTAAGLYYTSASNKSVQVTRLVLLTESGGEWARGVEPALPADANAIQGELHPYSVSCVSPGNCGVGGSYSLRAHHTGAFLLSQRDGVWATGAEVALPADAATKHQHAGITVSCTSLQNCTGVGSPHPSNGERGLLTAGPLQPTHMPNLEGMTGSAARQALASHGCSIRTVSYAYSQYVPKGRVISQTPATGARLTLGRKITIVVSVGRP